MVRVAVRLAIWMALASSTLIPVDAALAQGRLDARYRVTLAGIPIGKGSWVIDFAENQFTAAASGATAGLLSVFAGGQGTSASRGTMTIGKPVSTVFVSSITTDKKTEEIRITVGAGDLKEFEVNPPPQGAPDPERIPLTDAHRRGVLDPMSAMLLRMSSPGNPVVAKACERTVAVFDGRMRYNLLLAYKRMEQVKAEKGYEGPVVVCSVNFVPLAGYVPSRSAIKYLSNQRDMEIWLAPIGSARVLVPYRMSLPTPIGTGVMEATQFVSLPATPVATAANPKTQ